MSSKQQSDQVLNQVVTLAEARRRWGRARSHIILEIDKGRLVARKSGRVWLISVASLHKRWGKPFF